jgi:hypothetical protein
LTRDNGLAQTHCLSIAPAHNIIRQCTASSGECRLLLLETFEHVVCQDWHTGAPFFHFLAASQRRCSVFFALRLSNIEMGRRNQDRNREKPRDRCDDTKSECPLHHFLLQTFSSLERDNVVLAVALRGFCVALGVLAAESAIKIAVTVLRLFRPVLGSKMRDTVKPSFHSQWGRSKGRAVNWTLGNFDVSAGPGNAMPLHHGILNRERTRTATFSVRDAE